MKKYSLLRYGGETERHLVAIEEDGVFEGFASVTKDWESGEITALEIGQKYAPLSHMDLDNSTATEAEEEFVFGEKIAEPNPERPNPFRLSSLAEVIGVADKERDARAIASLKRLGIMAEDGTLLRPGLE